MFKKIKAAAGLMPQIIRIVKELIEAVEVPGHGQEKKQAVLDVVQAVWQTSGKYVPLPPWEWAEPVVAELIDAVVAVYNAVNHLDKFQNGGDAEE